MIAAINELAQLQQWVAWNYEGDINPNTGKRLKIPKNPSTGKNAKANNPATWASYDEARQIASRRQWAGVGFVLTKALGIVGGDIDNCIVDGVIHPLAQAILEAVATYCEVSPSGKGVRFIAKGTLPKALKVGLPDGMGLELYQTGRFLTITGEHLEDTPTTINDAQDALTTLYEQYRKPEKVKPTRTKPTARTNTGTSDATYPQAWVKVVVDNTLTTAVGMVATAPRGQKHNTRLAAGRLLGGLLAWLDGIGFGHVLDDTSAAERLYHANIPEHNGHSEYNTIASAIEQGRSEPLVIPPPEPRSEPQPSAAPWHPPVQQTTTINQRYLTLGMPATKTLLVKSPIGTGKTVATARMIPADASVLVITHRVALGQQQAERFGTDFYQDKKHNLEKCRRLTITLDSLIKLPLKPGAYEWVVIDESEQVLTHLTGKTISPGERRMVLQYLAFFLTQAKNVVYLDADLGALTHNFAEKIHGAGAITIVHNTYQPGNRSYVAMPQKADVLALLKKNLLDGQTAYVAINSKTQVHALERDLATFCPALRIMAISGENSHTPESQHFICNINSECVNYDVVIASPSLGTGVSIDTVYFDAVYLVGEQKINTHYDLHQMAGRVRTIKSGTVFSWIAPQTSTEQTDPAILRQWSLENYAETGVMANINKDTGALSTQDTDYLDLWADIHSTRNASMNALAANFYAAAGAGGHRFTHGAPATESERSTVKAASAVAREAVASEWYAAVIGATPISTEAYERLDRQENHTEDERAQMRQWEIRTFYEEPLSSITPELIKAHERGLRGKIIKLAHLFAPDLATHADTMSSEYLLPDQRNATAARQVRIELLGFVVTGDLCSSLTNTTQSPVTTLTDDLQPLGAWLAVNRERVQRLIGIHVDPAKPKTHMRFVGRVFEQLGLKAKAQQHKGCARTYALDSESLATVTAYAARYIARERARIADVLENLTPIGVIPQPEPAVVASAAPVVPPAPEPAAVPASALAVVASPPVLLHLPNAHSGQRHKRRNLSDVPLSAVRDNETLAQAYDRLFG